MEYKTLEKFEYLCSQDSPPACQSHCPLQVEAAAVTAQVASGHANEARKTLERHMPLAGLCGWLCEGPCMDHCLRKELGGPINLPLIERQAIRTGRASKPFPLPGTKHKAVLIGSALSALVCAQALAIKGHRVVVYHAGPIGAGLNDLPEEHLPKEALTEAVGVLRALKVEFRDTENPETDPLPSLEKLLEEYSGVFLALDDTWLSQLNLGLEPGGLAADPITRGTTRDKLFLGPGPGEKLRVEAMSAGKKAAGSMDRLFQGVNPATAREKESVGPTRLVVDLSDKPALPAAKLADPWNPTQAEAHAEAARCLSCTCLSCLPPCPLLRSRKGYPKKYAREFYNNIITAFGVRHSNRHINSCAECGLCGQICPNGADMGAFVHLARVDMVANSHMPASAHEFALEDQEYSNSPAVSFLRHPPGRDVSEWLFFPGCQLLGGYPTETLKTYRHLNESLGGRVGLWSGCCGAPGRWSGRRKLTGRTVDNIKNSWTQMGKPTIVLACPSCALFFKAELPEIPTQGLWPTLEPLPLPEGFQSSVEPLVIHDPCAGRLDLDGQAAVRSIMAKIGQQLIEPAMSGRQTLCCGYGGLASEASPEMGREYALERTSSSPGPILAWCSVCRDRFLALDHPSLHPLDLLFPPADLNSRLNGKPPGLSARRQGRDGFRREALSAIWRENLPKEAAMPLNIDIPGTVLDDMESRRILVADVTEVLEIAKKDGPVFVNPETGRRIANHRPRQVTFWVEYDERQDGSFLVHRAWCHRMTVPGVPGEGAESPASLEGFARTGGRV
ncbi:MAG: 4Fe-4S dicluster domain-containing protein [Deltaproteobacteria bacterium]|jgi:Fe-S oxidoreductase|nr:4Fe-4S dicluster domain-containing protein [Deltaproteobacteria bacterium]